MLVTAPERLMVTAVVKMRGEMSSQRCGFNSQAGQENVEDRRIGGGIMYLKESRSLART